MKRLNDLSVTKKLKNTNLSYFLTLNDISFDARFLPDNPEPIHHELGRYKNELGLLTYAIFAPLRDKKRKL